MNKTNPVRTSRTNKGVLKSKPAKGQVVRAKLKVPVVTKPKLKTTKPKTGYGNKTSVPKPKKSAPKNMPNKNALDLATNINDLPQSFAAQKRQTRATNGGVGFPVVGHRSMSNVPNYRGFRK